MFFESEMPGGFQDEEPQQHDGQPITPQRPPQQQQQHPAETCPVRRSLEAERRRQAQQMRCDL